MRTHETADYRQRDYGLQAKAPCAKGCSKALPAAVYLDGDWCWRMDPFIVDEENKAMVVDHIVHLLRGFLTNSHFENVIFCWVIHQETIFDSILKPLADLRFQLEKITLMLSPQQLRAHFAQDAAAGRGGWRMRRPASIGWRFIGIWIPLSCGPTA